MSDAPASCVCPKFPDPFAPCTCGCPAVVCPCGTTKLPTMTFPTKATCYACGYEIRNPGIDRPPSTPTVPAPDGRRTVKSTIAWARSIIDAKSYHYRQSRLLDRMPRQRRFRPGRPVVNVPRLAAIPGINLVYERNGSRDGSYLAATSTITLSVDELQTFYHELGHHAHAKIYKRGPSGWSSVGKRNEEATVEMAAAVLMDIFEGGADDDAANLYIRRQRSGRDIESLAPRVLKVVAHVIGMAFAAKIYPVAAAARRDPR